MFSDDAQPPGNGEVFVLPRSEKPKASLLISTTSQAQRLEACLRSLLRHLDGGALGYEVVIVMNAATPEVRELVLQRVRGALVADSPVNLGLAGGANRARSLATGEYLVLLHDDAEVQPGWLEALVEAADAHPEAGAVASLVLNFDGSVQSTGMIIWKDFQLSVTWCEKPRPQPDAFQEVEPIDMAASSSLLVRASTWDAIGGLDERLYPAYCVDVDIGMAIHHFGQTMLLQPRSRAFHHRGSSSTTTYKRYLKNRNRQIILAKWKDQIAKHEPWQGVKAEAYERAKNRTRRVAEELARNWNEASRPPAAPKPHDPVKHEAEHLERDKALKLEYRQFLEEMHIHLVTERDKWAADKKMLKLKLADKSQQVEDLKLIRAELKQKLHEIEHSIFGRCYRLFRRFRRKR